MLTKEEKKGVLQNYIKSLEAQRLQQEINYRVWQAESLLKANEKNTALLTAERAKNEILDKQIAKGKELLAEIEAS